MTSALSGALNPEFDRLRGAAIAMVVFHHWSFLFPSLSHSWRLSWTGVDLFFVLSGYLVTLSYLAAEERARGEPKTDASGMKMILRFWKRRLLRVGPAAVATALVTIVLSYTFNFSSVFGAPGDRWRELLALVGLVYNYAHLAGMEGKLFQFWSLAVEEHFYLLLPLAFALLKTARARLLFALSIVVLTWAVARPLVNPALLIANNDALYLRYASHLRFDALAAGACLGLIQSRHGLETLSRDWGKKDRLIALCSTFVLAAILMTLPGLHTPFSHGVGFIAYWAISGALVVLAAQRKDVVFGVPILAPALEFLGRRSYSIYLWHIPVQLTWMEIDARIGTGWKDSIGSSVATGIALVATTFLVSELSFRVFELSFMKTRRVAA